MPYEFAGNVKRKYYKTVTTSGTDPHTTGIGEWTNSSESADIGYRDYWFYVYVTKTVYPVQDGDELISLALNDTIKLSYRNDDFGSGSKSWGKVQATVSYKDGTTQSYSVSRGATVSAGEKAFTNVLFKTTESLTYKVNGISNSSSASNYAPTPGTPAFPVTLTWRRTVTQEGNESDYTYFTESFDAYVSRIEGNGYFAEVS